MERITRIEVVATIHGFDLTGPLVDAIAYLERIRTLHPDQTLYLDDDEDILEVYYKRPETDYEYQVRVDAEQQHAQAVDNRLREDYLRLKARFEGESQ